MFKKIWKKIKEGVELVKDVFKSIFTPTPKKMFVVGVVVGAVVVVGFLSAISMANAALIAETASVVLEATEPAVETLVAA